MEMPESVLERVLVRGKILSGAAIGVALVVCGFVVRDMIIRIKGDPRDYSIEVSGAARRTARASSAAWEGTLELSVQHVADGHAVLEGVRERMRTYIVSQGLAQRFVRFPAPTVEEVRHSDGKFNTQIVGYVLGQRVSVQDADGDKLEHLAARTSELIDAAGIQGGEFVWKPQDVAYAYENLDGMKQQALAAAVQNAKLRASSIAAAADVHLGEMRQFELGDVEVRTPGSQSRYSDDESSPTKDIIANVKILYHVR